MRMRELRALLLARRKRLGMSREAVVSRCSEAGVEINCYELEYIELARATMPEPEKLRALARTLRIDREEVLTAMGLGGEW